MNDANIGVVQNMYAAFGRGDIDNLVGLVTPDVEWNAGGVRRQYPPYGPRKGSAEVAEFFRTVTEVCAFTEFSPREFYSDRDKVFVLGSYAGNMRKSGRKFDVEWVMVFTFRNGKVAQFREFTDTYAVEHAYTG
jgi:ketosteroid isomerase-like protein